jgi:hypothetical protein
VQLAWLRTLLWGVVALVVLAANWRWWTQTDEDSSTEPKPALDPVAGD